MSNSKKNILIVDDFDDVRLGLLQVLQDEGYNVSNAPNGIEALKKIKKDRIDLLITDILMPEMDGIELVNQANELGLPDIQYILISGGGRKLSGGYDYLETTKKLTGINNLLKKPFRTEDLISMVDKLLAE